MKTRALLICVLALLGISCSSQPADPVIECLEEFITTEPYLSNFVALEQALIADGYLQSADGQAYRRMVEEMIENNDPVLLLPTPLQFEAIPEAHYCYRQAEGEPPVLLRQLSLAKDSVSRGGNRSIALLFGAFLYYFPEADWNQTLTPHLFYSYINQRIAIDDRSALVKLPPWSDEEPDITQVKGRNVLRVLVNDENQILIREEQVELDQVREIVKNFIANPMADPDLAESPSKAILSLRNERGTSYATYLEVYNELKAAYHELWDDYCQREFGYPYSDDLPIKIQKEVKGAIPFIISEAEPTAFEGE